MIKAAMASMARYANLPLAVPVGRSHVLRYLPASAQIPLHLQSNLTSQNSVSAGGVYGSSRFYPARSERILSRHSGLRHIWLAGTPSHLRGFASSTKDVASSAASAVPAAAGPGLPPPSGSEGAATGGPADSISNVAESTRNAVNSLLESTKDAAGKMFPAVDNWMDPSGGGAWLVLPRVLRKFHSYVESGPTARLLGRLPQEKQPYELSVFSALDLPARFLASAVTFSYL
jgi:hypothetical protein